MFETPTNIERATNLFKLAAVTCVATSIAMSAVFLGMWAAHAIP